MNRQVKSMLSLAQRAGKIVTGEIIEKVVSNGEAFLVIIAEDAGVNTKKKYVNKCEHYAIEYIMFSNKEELSNCIGKYNRSVFAITDNNFAEKIRMEFSNMM